MLGISIIVLALAVGQIVGDDQVKPGALPFEITNPSQVPGGELYQADMLLTEQQRQALKKRKAIRFESLRWPEVSDGNPLVPYIFLDAVNQTDVQRGIDHWSEHTCINFEQTTNTDQPHLKFFIGSGCFSYVGIIDFKNSINAAGQLISDENGEYGQQISPCNDFSTVVHEIGHAIGFHHEQSRSDRDAYLTILFENVLDGKGHNFDKEVDNNYSVPYDYSSNMHYGIDFFSNDKPYKPTILTLDPSAQELIGARNTLTHRDKLTANRLYNCTGKWLEKCGKSSDPCLNDGYTGKDCACVCPPGTAGSNCENIVDDYYAAYRSSFSEKISSEKAITVETPIDSGTRFTKWIVPPTCQNAKVTFTTNNFADFGCKLQYLYVKTNFSEEVGQIMCKEDISVGVTIESDKGIFITMNNHVSYGFKTTLWAADVTFENITGCPSTDPPTELSTEPPTKSPTTPEDTKTACDCKKKLSKAVESITIRNFPEDSADNCGWDIQAANEKSLGITCDNKNISAKDDTGSSVRLNIQFYTEF